MNSGSTLSAYGAILAVVFGGAWAAGTALAPVAGPSSSVAAHHNDGRAQPRPHTPTPGPTTTSPSASRDRAQPDPPQNQPPSPVMTPHTQPPPAAGMVPHPPEPADRTVAAATVAPGPHEDQHEPPRGKAHGHDKPQGMAYGHDTKHKQRGHR